MARPEFVERCVDVLRTNDQIAYVTSWLAAIDADGNSLGPGYHPLGNACGGLELLNFAGDAAALVRRRVFDRGLWYSEQMTSYEDWLFYRRLQRAGLYGHVIPEPLLVYRVRTDSMLRSIGEVHYERLLGEMQAELRADDIEWIQSNA
jgi:hypothetical protein